MIRVCHPLFRWRYRESHLDPLQFEIKQWVVLVIAAMLIGVGKSGVPGIGVLAPVMLVLAMPDRAALSVGVLLPMLIVGDLAALAYHRRHAAWGHLRRALPWAFGGILLGFGLLLGLRWAGVDINSFLKRAIGVIVLVVLALSEWLRRRRSADDVSIAWWLAPFLGLLGGVMTMLANAAGPIFACYMLALALPKRAFMGTAAWLFFILNVVKVPLHLYLGNITPATLRFDLKMIPAIAVGAGLGILLFRWIPEKAFRAVVYTLTVAACVKLLWAW